MKYVFCTIAIGEKYLKGAISLALKLNYISDNHHFLVVTDNIPEKINNTTFIKIDEDKKTFIQNIFNYNLKYLPIKVASEMDFDFVFFIDADWSLDVNYSHEKIVEVMSFMNNNDYDFCFERPHRIGDGKLDESQLFWKHKRDFYNLLSTDEFDDGHVCIEQFLIFKNNHKLKKFVSFWESLNKKAEESNLWAYAEGVEIGMSSSHSNMNCEYNKWQIILNKCFSFTSVDGTFYKRF